MRPSPGGLRAAVVLAAFSVAAAAPPSARAAVISADELEGKSLVAGVIARGFSFLLGGDILAPPYALEDADPSAAGVLALRAYLAWRDAGWKLVVHDELVSAVRSRAAGGALPLGRGVAPPRLLPLRAELSDDATQTIASTVDWLYAAVSVGPVTITAGRQPVTFGRGHVWRPTDLVATFTLTEVDTEYKPGADALRLDLAVGSRTQLTLVGAAGELEEDGDLRASLRGSSVVARLEHGWERLEVGLLGGLVRRDAVLAADAVWDAGPAQVFGEVVGTRVAAASLASPVAGDGAIVARAVAGATFRIAKLSVTPELLYNGFGAWDPADTLAVAQSERVAIGEQILLGRVYAATSFDWEVHPLLHLAGVALVNLRDPSALASLALSYSVSDNVQALAGGYLPVGARPALEGGLEARSEYGLFPLFGFVELKLAI